MRTLQEKYNGVLEGKFSKTQFRRDAAIEVPQFVSTVNSFDDTVSILKNKGAITEAKTEEPKYSTAKPEDTIAPDVLDTGIKFELDKKYGTLDVTPEQYAKCREVAIKNLAKDVLYYVKQDSIQLDAPGEQMEKAKLNESLSAEAIKDMKEKLFDAALAGKGLEDASTDELEIYAQIAAQEEDHIGQTNYFEYLESLPNYKPEFTPANLRKVSQASIDMAMSQAGMKEEMSKEEAWEKFQKDNNVTDKTTKIAREDFEKEWAKRTDEVKIRVKRPGAPEFEAEEGKDYSEEEADKYIANAEKHGATPMGTKFAKTDEAIQNIENDDQTKRRIASLTNQLLQVVDPRDEVVKAYAISVKNDLESGDASRLKRYKDLISLDDLKDDMEHYISHDVDQLEESQYSISDIQNKFPDKAFDIQQAALRAVDASDVQAAYNKSAGEFEQALYRAAHGNLEESIELSAEDMEKLHKDGKITLPNGSVLHYTGAAEEGVTYPEDKHTLTPDELGNQVHRAKSPYKLKEEREALKEMFKKIITKVIND